MIESFKWNPDQVQYSLPVNIENCLFCFKISNLGK